MRQSRRRCWLLFVVIAFVLSTTGAVDASAVASPSAPRDRFVEALAAPGDLDRSFGGAGQVTTGFQGHARGQGIAFQADGKVIVTGVAGAFRNDDQDIAVARYLESGRLDRSFGGEGRVRTDVTGKSDTATSVLLQPDGMILVGGAGDTFPGSERASDFSLVRYTPSGELDPNFGNGGKVTTDFDSTRDSVQALALQPDGKIVAAGVSFDDLGDGPLMLALARYNADGSLDTTFGTDGKVVTIGGQILAVSILPDARIRAAGIDGGRFLLASYTQNGSLDTSFGDNGIVMTDAGAFLFRGTMMFAPDGSIFAQGALAHSNLRCSSWAFAVDHFLPDGSLDASFGIDGAARTIVTCTSYAQDVTLQADGKIVAAGFAYPGFGEGVFALVRYNQDGSRDQSFGRHGTVTTRFANAQAKAWAVGIDSRGRVVAAGIAGSSFALARYLS